MDKTNVSGRNTRPNPPPGHPPPGSKKGKSNTSKKRSRSSGPGQVKSGDTPDEKIQNQGNLVNKSPSGAQTPAAALILGATAGGNSTNEASNPLAPVLGTGTGQDNSEAQFSTQEMNRLLASSPNHPSGKTNSAITAQVMASPTKSTGSVSSLVNSKCYISEPLEDDDAEIGDLTQDELDQIEKSEIGDGKGDSSDEPPPKKTFAEAAKEKKKCYEILYIHLGDEERLPILKEQFYKLFDRINTGILEKVLQGEDVPDGIIWRSWSKGRGLVATADKETSDLLIETVKNTKLGKKSFRAWQRGSFSEGRLVTGHIEGNATKCFKQDNVMEILIKQNRLKGSYTGVKFTDSDSGRLLQFFADKTLWSELLAKRAVQGTSKVRLKMGWSPVNFTLSKPKPAPGETKASEETSAAAPAAKAASITAMETSEEAAATSGNLNPPN